MYSFQTKKLEICWEGSTPSPDFTPPFIICQTSKWQHLSVHLAVEILVAPMIDDA